MGWRAGIWALAVMINRAGIHRSVAGEASVQKRQVADGYAGEGSGGLQ